MASCAHAPHPEFQDSDLRRLIAWLPGAYDLRSLSWAHVRVWGAAGRGCHTPAWPGNARFARSSYVNRALLRISTSADPCCSLTGVAYLACPIMGHSCASELPLAAATMAVVVVKYPISDWARTNRLTAGHHRRMLHASSPAGERQSAKHLPRFIRSAQAFSPFSSLGFTGAQSQPGPGGSCELFPKRCT